MQVPKHLRQTGRPTCSVDISHRVFACLGSQRQRRQRLLRPPTPRCARGIEKEKQEVEKREKEKKAKAKVLAF